MLHYWLCDSNRAKAIEGCPFFYLFFVRCHINRGAFLIQFVFPSQRWCHREWSFNIDQFCHLTSSWEQLTPVPALEEDTRGKLVLWTDRLYSECWLVCQNIQSYSAALCVMCLALLSSGLQISIHPTRVAFKLLLEPFCFVTHSHLMDYCAGS